MDRKLVRALRQRGATREEIDHAAGDGILTLLTLDRLLVPGTPHLTPDDVAERSGVSTETATLLWRALGFPDVPEDDRLFTDESVEVLRLLAAGDDQSMLTIGEDAELVTQVRAVGAGLARVAEALSDQIAAVVAEARHAGATDEEVAATVVGGLDWPLLARLNDYALRVQVRAALWRKLLEPAPTDGPGVPLAVGFLDLVGYTALSQELDPAELSALVERFESVTYDTVARLGARLVKTIGDEVMFVAEDPAVALEVALVLTDRTKLDEVLPRARAGLAFGPALAREGDYYGSVVNLAHRLVELARPSSVIVAAEVAEALGDRSEFEFSRLRSRRIRGIGRVEIYVAVGREDSAPADSAVTPG